jgi:hypothetical protein
MLSMTSTEILEHARRAGAAGRDWSDYTCNDDELSRFCEDNVETFDVEAIRTAFDAGRAAWCEAYWRTVWTTAPDGYDHSGTRTVERCGAWRGQELRRVLVEPRRAVGQIGRYHSGGIYVVSDADPRVAEREAEERAARIRASDEAFAALRAGGLAWLQAASEDEIDAAYDADDVQRRGISYGDVRAERRKRDEARAEAARAATWERCRGAFADGATILDPGRPAERGRFGVIPAREPHVYYRARVVGDWAKVADQAEVQDAGGECAGSLERVAQLLADGTYRLVEADAVPPEPVTHRIGHDRYDRIVRVQLPDRVVWVGRPRFAAKPIILEASGHITRSQAAMRAGQLAYADAGCP